MTTPDPARQAAYDAVYEAIGHLGAAIPRDEVRRNALIWTFVHTAIEAYEAASHVLDPEVAEVVADTIERWEKR